MHPKSHLLARYPVRIWLVVTVASMVGLTIALQAADPGDPAWWATGGITNSNTVDDYAAVNQGQLKNLAVQTANQFTTLLAPFGGMGSALTTVVTSLSATTSSTDDYAAVNLGQLKSVAQPFYLRLQQIGAFTTLPAWTTPGDTGSDDYSLANTGQAKNIFSFVGYFNWTPLSNGQYSIENNGLGDAWEVAYFGQIGLNSSADPTGDGLTNAQKFSANSDPLSADNGAVSLLLYK
jgi:hypothetical protein